jgi:DNA-binding winged helix-turn-helix (wHTH) protein
MSIFSTNDLEIEEKLTIGDLTIDPVRIRVWRAGQERQLSISEFSILLALARNPEKEFSRSELLKFVRRRGSHREDRSIDRIVVSIRRKTRAPGYPEVIATVFGQGYKFNTLREQNVGYTIRRLPMMESDRVAELTRIGESVRDIARKLGLNRSKVNRIQARLRAEGKL